MSLNPTRDPHDEYIEAMRRVKTALRAGRQKEARDWLDVAERCMRIQKLFDGMISDKDKRETSRAERPHRLQLLQRRVHHPR